MTTEQALQVRHILQDLEYLEDLRNAVKNSSRITLRIDYKKDGDIEHCKCLDQRMVFKEPFELKDHLISDLDKDIKKLEEKLSKY